MELLILVLIVFVVGYLLSRNQTTIVSQTTKASKTVTEKSKSLGTGARHGWNRLFGRWQKKPDFTTWAVGPGASELPDDFKEWLISLPENEKKEFVEALSAYASGLDFDLVALIDGRMESQPQMKRVFVETIVIYSNAYRKVAKARAESEAPVAEPPKETGSSGERQPAEKVKSRRSANPDMVEPAVMA
jgi:hypothetical protein